MISYEFSNIHIFQKLKCKSKSAHDILTDETLSKELAVPMEELFESSVVRQIYYLFLIHNFICIT